MDKEAQISLLKAMTLLQSTVLSCIDRKHFPFTKTQLSIFTVLSMEGEMTMKLVAQYIASSKEQATRAVAPLVDAGYVARRTDPANRTRVYVALTEKGKTTLSEYWASLTNSMSVKLNRSLNEEEKETLLESATNMISLLEKVK